MKQYWMRFRFRFVLWAFADVVETLANEWTDAAVNPQSGWVWQEEQYTDYLRKCVTSAVLKKALLELDTL